MHKVSIIPRGFAALGYTMQRPNGDRFLMTQGELESRIHVLLAGTITEEIIFHDISTGASNDLERVTQLAKSMVVIYGMSEKLPNLSLVQQSGPGFLGQTGQTERRSERVEEVIDEEILGIIRTCYAETKAILKSKRDLLDKMAAVLIEKEVIEYEEIRDILGASPKEKEPEAATSKKKARKRTDGQA